MAPSESASEERTPEVTAAVRRLTDHVVQVEALCVYLLITITSLAALQSAQVPIAPWLVPAIFLASVRLVVRVTNPISGVRNRLTWASSLGGLLGAIVGGVTDVLTGGLTGGQGALLGTAGGAALGLTLGNMLVDQEIKGYDKNRDGRRYYAVEDLDAFIEESPRRTAEHPA